MIPFRISEDARRDVANILRYVRNESVSGAVRLGRDIDAAVLQLSRHPGMGHHRDDLVPRARGLRFWAVSHYLIIYRVSRNVLEIVRVISGYRDVASILQDEREEGPPSH